MAIKRPDIYEHNNPNLPIVDSDFVKGGIRSAVQNLSDLYALTSKSEQLKQHSTQVYVSGQNAFYLLKDINNIGNSNGWIQMTGAGGPGGSVTLENIVYTTGNQTVSGIKNFVSLPTVNSTGVLLQDNDIIVNSNIFRIFNTGRGNIFGGQIIISGGSATGENPNIGGPIRFIGGRGGAGISGFFEFIGESITFNNNVFLVQKDGRIQCKSTASLERPTVNGTGTLLSGEAIESNSTIKKMIKLTQAEYNALSPKDPQTFYVIVG